MKKLYFVFSILIVMIFFAGCVAENGRAATLDSDFFDRKIEGEITISAYESAAYRSFLEDAARAFEAQYPGTKVNVETFSAMPEVRTGQGQGNMTMSLSIIQNDPNARSDYLSRINTNIMSGTGADIYAMDIIPLHKFTESGTLENLEPYMNLDPDFNKSDYRQNILDALRYRGGTWFLPTDYFFRYYAYDSTLVPAQIAAEFGVDKAWSMEELFSLSLPLYDGSYKLYNGIDSMLFTQLLNENIASYVNLESGRSYFADGRFASLLSSVKDYGRQGYIPSGITGQQDAGQLMQQVMRTPTDRFFYKLNSSISLTSQFTRGLGNRLMSYMGGTAAAITSDDEIAGIQANADGSVPFDYNQAYAINSQSKNKETAWAFIKFLLSKEMQLSGNPFYYPLHNEAREEKAGLALFSGLSSSAALNEQQIQALESYKAAVESLSDNINCYVIRDTNINDMVIQEVGYFFEGTRSADETARVLQNKADLYLSE